MNINKKIMTIFALSFAAFSAPESSEAYCESEIADDSCKRLPKEGVPLFHVADFYNNKNECDRYCLVNNDEENRDEYPYKIIYFEKDGTSKTFRFYPANTCSELYETGIIDHQYTNVSPKEISPTKLILPYLCNGSYLVCCLIQSGFSKGYYLVTQNYRGVILSTEDFEALNRLETVKGFTLDPNTSLIDVDVRDQDNNALFKLKTPEAIPMSDLCLKLGFTANFSGYNKDYNTIEINGKQYTKSGWDTFSQGTKMFNFDSGSSIKIYDQTRLPDRMARLLFHGEESKVKIPRSFSTSQFLSKTLDSIDFNLLRVYVDGKRVVACDHETTSEEIITLPEGDDIVIMAESCERVYKIDHETGASEMFYLKWVGKNTEIYKDTGSEDIFIGNIPQKQCYDNIIEGKYLKNPYVAETTRTQIGTMNKKPVYLLDFSNMTTDRVIQTAARVLALTPDELELLKSGKKVRKTIGECCEEIQLDN